VEPKRKQLKEANE